MKYISEKELRSAIEKKLEYELSDGEWNDYSPDWNPPFDNSDLQEIIRHIPHEPNRKTRKSKDLLKSAYVRSKINVQSVQTLLEKARIKLFGSPEPPFNNLDDMREWIELEAKKQPLPEQFAPRYGYLMPKDISGEDLYKLHEERPGIYGAETPVLDYPSTDKWTYRVPVAEGTIIKRLWLSVRSIAKRLDCQEAQATGLILTGMIPLVSPIIAEAIPTFNADGLNQGKIVITIREPVSDKVVLELYRKLRERLWGHKRDHKLPTDKDCSLVEFMSSRYNSDNPDWEKLRIEWNHLYPDWYFDYWRYLRTTYERAKDKVLHQIKFGPVVLKN